MGGRPRRDRFFRRLLAFREAQGPSTAKKKLRPQAKSPAAGIHSQRNLPIHHGIAAPKSEGIGAASVVRGGGGSIFCAGAGAAGIGEAGAAAGVDPQALQLLQHGQTQSTLHVRTGTSFVHGNFTNCLTLRTRQLQPEPCWQPLLQVSQPLEQLPHLSQPPHRSQMGVTPGMQIVLQAQARL